MQALSELVKIAVHGVPRSGTSWIGEILNSSPRTIYKFQPLFSYAMKGFLTPDSSAERVSKFFSTLIHRPDDFLDQTEARKAGTLPTFKKNSSSHLVYKEVRYHHVLENMLQRAPDLRLVAVIRDPVAVISSWVSAPREFRGALGWSVAGEWRYAAKKNQGRPEEYFGFEKWKEAAQLFLKLEKTFPARVHMLAYEDLLRSTEQEVERLFQFCALEVDDQTREFLVKSTTTEVPGEYSVYRASNSLEARRSVLGGEIAEIISGETRAANLGRFLVDAQGALR